MKATITILVAFVISATAQTNTTTKTNDTKPKPVAPTMEQVQAALDVISKRLTQIESERNKLNDLKNHELKKLILEKQANKIDASVSSKRSRDLDSKYTPLYGALAKERAELKLQEFNIRERYGISETSKNKRSAP